MKDLSSIHKIDLHIHSTVSDGTDTPGEILEIVKASGFDLFSVTDHDAIGACISIKELLREDDPLFLSGVEFSCKDPFGKYHILGYGYDSSCEAICSLVDKTHEMRVEKMGIRLEILKKKFGLLFSDEDLGYLFSQNNPGKPHLADLLLKEGFVRSRREAFSEFLSKLETSKNYYASPEEAINAIKKSGGIAILAHPSRGSGSELIRGEEMEKRLLRLIDLGIQGMEGFYSNFTPEMQAEILSLAEKYGLYVTAGSDYHGSHKKVSIGENNLGDASDAPRGLLRFLEDVSLR